MPFDLIPRRSLLQAAVRVAALPVGVQFFSVWARAAQQHQHSSNGEQDQSAALADYKPQFFNQSDFDALQAMTELLIPTDETPGAREAHCAHFIDFLLHSMDKYSPETQKQWRTALAALATAGFHSADAAHRASLLQQISEPERDPHAHHPAYAAYQLIKRENCFAFYTAKVGIIGALDYRGNSYNVSFPACTHPEHHVV